MNSAGADGCAELDAQCMKKEEAVSARSTCGTSSRNGGAALQERESLERGERGFRPAPGGARTALRELVSQYAVRSMASEFIKRTRRMYEEEKQPQVRWLPAISPC